jgi:hypothetical protein
MDKPEQAHECPTNEQLEPIFAALAKRVKDAVIEITDDALGGIECRYLPHLETDFFLNAREIARQALNDFMVGRESDTSSWFKPPHLRGEVLDRIYEMHHDEIVRILGEDMKARIKFLEEMLSERRMH